MTERVSVGGLRVARVLYDFITDEAPAGHRCRPRQLLGGVDKVVTDLTPKNQELLARRDELQAQIDKWHRHRVIEPLDTEAYRAFLTEIGYLLPEPEDFTVTTAGVDDEIAVQAARSWWCRCSTPGSRSTPPTHAGDRCTTRCTEPT